VLQTVWSNFNHCDVIGPKAAKFSEIMQNNGNYAAQDHSRSPLSLPIESLYATLFFVLYSCNLQQ